MTIGQLVKQTRERAGLTQTEFAEKLGWPQSRLAELEKDRTNPTFARLRHVAEKLEVPLWKLIKPLG